MLEDSNKIWCVAGLPGAGKTHFCETLARAYGFGHLSRDQMFLDIWGKMDLDHVEDIVGPRNNFIWIKDWLEALETEAEKMRDRFRRVLKIVSLPGFDAGRDCAEVFEHGLKVDDDELLNFVLSSKQFLNFFVSLLSSFEIVEQAERIATQVGKVVLIDDFELCYAARRKKVLDYFRSRGIDPGLVLIRASKEALAKSYGDRLAQEDDPKKLGFDKVSGLEFVDVVDPYMASEGWGRVVVVDRVLGQAPARKDVLIGANESVGFLVEG